MKNYTRIDTVGKGATSEVFRAKNAAGIDVAIKVLPRNCLSSEKYFKQETEILRALSHENVVRLHDAFEDESNYYIVLEYLQGGELFKKMEDADNGSFKETFNEEEVKKLAAQIISCVEYYHRKGIVHRDIKPENIMFDDKGKIRIADFAFGGFSKGFDLKGRKGTCMYMSPETINNEMQGKPVDMWSVGILLFILLSGSYPYTIEALHNYDLINNQIRKGIEYNPFQWYDISDEGVNFIERLLTVDPHSRITATQCLSHPWLKDAYDQLVKGRKLSRKRKLRSIFLAVVAVTGFFKSLY